MPETTPQPFEPRQTDRKVRSPGKRWVLVVLTLILFTTSMDSIVLMPLGPKLMELFQITPKQFSYLVSAYSLAAGMFGFVGSLFFDRVDRKVSLIGSYFGFLIGTLFCAYAPSYSVLLVARAVSGAFAGLLSGICYAIVGDLFPISERGLATGKLLTAYSLASIVGVPFGLHVSNTIGWHATFGLIVVLGTFAIILAIQVVPRGSWNIPIRQSGIFSGITENLRDRNARYALLTTLMMVHSQFVVIPFISAYLVSNTGFPAISLPQVYLVGGIATVLSGILMGKVCDRFGADRVFPMTGLLFLIPIFFLTRLSESTLILTLSLTTLVFVLSNFRSVPAVTMISSSIPPERRGSFLSLNSCLHQLGAASATFGAGFLIEEGQGGAPMIGFANTAYLSIAFGIIAYLAGKRIRIIS